MRITGHCDRKMNVSWPGVNEQRRLQYQQQVTIAVSEEGQVETVVLSVAEVSAPTPVKVNK